VHQSGSRSLAACPPLADAVVQPRGVEPTPGAKKKMASISSISPPVTWKRSASQVWAACAPRSSYDASMA
jgi:hypothetical protein